MTVEDEARDLVSRRIRAAVRRCELERGSSLSPVERRRLSREEAAAWATSYPALAWLAGLHVPEQPAPAGHLSSLALEDRRWDLAEDPSPRPARRHRRPVVRRAS